MAGGCSSASDSAGDASGGDASAGDAGSRGPGGASSADVSVGAPGSAGDDGSGGAVEGGALEAPPTGVSGPARGRLVIGSILIFIGTVGLLEQLSWLDWLDWDRLADLWPLILINTSEMRTLPLAIAGLASVHCPEMQILIPAATLGIVQMLIVFFAFQRQFVEGVTMSGLKT